MQSNNNFKPTLLLPAILSKIQETEDENFKSPIQFETILSNCLKSQPIKKTKPLLIKDNLINLLSENKSITSSITRSSSYDF